MFETRRGEVFFSQNEKEVDLKDKKVAKKIQEMNRYGLEAISLYDQIYNFFQSEDYNDELNSDNYIQSVINAKFALAKIYSGLFATNQKDRVENLKKSLENYRFIKDYIKKKGEEKGSLNFDFSEQLKMCNEMCDMLPVKIDKMNMGFY